jgi:Domain of unknown function (DUF4333)
LVSLVTSCRVGPGHTLSASSVSEQIAARLKAQYAADHPSVTCPSGVPDRRSQTFVCAAVIDGQTVEMDGVVTGSGRFTVQPRAAIISVATLESSLASELHKQTGVEPAVECGSKAILIVDIGGSFSCSAVFPGGNPRDVKVTVVDIQGGYRYQLAPATTAAPVSPGGPGG